jgi:hypothetical protein
MHAPPPLLYMPLSQAVQSDIEAEAEFAVLFPASQLAQALPAEL